jgi:hypothetical protein
VRLLVFFRPWRAGAADGTMLHPIGASILPIVIASGTSSLVLSTCQPRKVRHIRISIFHLEQSRRQSNHLFLVFLVLEIRHRGCATAPSQRR